MLTPEQLGALPLFYRKTIPTDYLDAMGHMNIRWYMALFDEAARRFFASFGMTQAYYDAAHSGAFALEQHIRYQAEVREGDTIVVRTRVLGRSAKRVHFMHFMIDESTGKPAATLESLGSHADLRRRRTSPFPTEIADQLDSLIEMHQRFTWDAPVCGVIQP